MTEGRALVVTGRTLERRGWPVVEVVDRTEDDPRTGLFSERLARRLHGVLDGVGGRAVCILNRTGRTRLLACRQCAALARCTRCGGPVAQAAAGGHLECRRCGESRPAVCADCDSTRLKSLRMGVTRATEELSALTGVDAVEFTGSSDPARGDGARLVVGTEAALHRIHRADLVCFLDIDQHLLAPRFGAGEETLSLLARAARLVGTRDAGGRVLVQTRMPEHEVLGPPSTPTRRCSRMPSDRCGSAWTCRPSARWPPSGVPAPPPSPRAWPHRALSRSRRPTVTGGWSGPRTTGPCVTPWPPCPGRRGGCGIEVDPTDV